MSKRKVFGISQNLNRGLSETINAVKNHAGQFRYEVIALSRIEPDPENPRELALTPQDIELGISADDKDFRRKQAEHEKLKLLAATITSKGLINPVVVYKTQDKYQLVAGERRYLASLIAKKEDIQARILNEKPKGMDLRLLQWIENTEREELSLKDRMSNIQAIIDEYKKENMVEQLTATHIKDLMNISLSQATCYLAILQAPQDVLESIAKEKVTNLDKAVLIAKLENPEIRQKALTACIAGNSLKDIKQLVTKMQKISAVKSTIKQAKKKGRVATRVTMGTTRNPLVIEKIIFAVLNQPDYQQYQKIFASIDWTHYSQVTKAFRHLIEILEKKVEAA